MLSRPMIFLTSCIYTCVCVLILSRNLCFSNWCLLSLALWSPLHVSWSQNPCTVPREWTQNLDRMDLHDGLQLGEVTNSKAFRILKSDSQVLDPLLQCDSPEMDGYVSSLQPLYVLDVAMSVGGSKDSKAKLSGGSLGMVWMLLSWDVSKNHRFAKRITAICTAWWWLEHVWNMAGLWLSMKQLEMECHHPNLMKSIIFQRGRYTTNQCMLGMVSYYRYYLLSVCSMWETD